MMARADGDRLLDGWGEIAKVLTESAGVEISIDQAKRYERDHGLPVKRIGPGVKKRVVASLERVVDWCIREFG